MLHPETSHIHLEFLHSDCRNLKPREPFKGPVPYIGATALLVT